MRKMVVTITLLVNIMLLVLLVFAGLTEGASALESGSIDELTRGFTENLNEEIDEIVSNAINNTNDIINSTTAASLSNLSNLSSSQIIVSNNRDVLANASEGDLILNQIQSKNGQCYSNIVGGSGSDTISSTGVCNDQLTGGLGADRFICGEGTDAIRDYNSDEGDIIIDRQNCETII
jgi:hypothetical protein